MFTALKKKLTVSQRIKTHGPQQSAGHLAGANKYSDMDSQQVAPVGSMEQSDNTADNGRWQTPDINVTSGSGDPQQHSASYSEALRTPSAAATGQTDSLTAPDDELSIAAPDPAAQRQKLQFFGNAQCVELIRQSAAIHRAFLDNISSENDRVQAMHTEYRNILVKKVSLELEIDRLNPDGRLDSGPFTREAKQLIEAWEWYDHYRSRVRGLDAQLEEIDHRRDGLFGAHRIAHGDMIQALDDLLVEQDLLPARSEGTTSRQRDDQDDVV